MRQKVVQGLLSRFRWSPTTSIFDGFCAILNQALSALFPSSDLKIPTPPTGSVLQGVGRLLGNFGKHAIGFGFFGGNPRKWLEPAQPTRQKAIQGLLSRFRWSPTTSIFDGFLADSNQALSALFSKIGPQKIENSPDSNRQDMEEVWICLLYTSPSPRDYAASRMPSSA